MRRQILVGLCALLAACHDDLPVPDPTDGLVEAVGLAPAPADAASRALSTPPQRQGNTARLLINGEASLAARLDLIATAKRSIHVQALIFKADRSGRMLADALLARKRADPDLDIHVIVDAYANIQDVQAQLMYFELQNAGIDVEGFEAFYLQVTDELNLDDWLAGNKRYHEKYLVVDGERAVVGGMNIADEYFRCSDDPALTWRDQDLLVEGSVAADIDAAFVDNQQALQAVKAARPELLDPDAYWRRWQRRHPVIDMALDKAIAVQRAALDKVAGDPAVRCDGTPVATRTWEGVPVQFIRSRPRENERHIEATYVARIAAAKHSVIIENAYFVPSPQLQAALVDAAGRGVAVTVVTNSEQTNDIPMITVAGRARYRALLDAGVEVREWHAERVGEGTIHAKLAVFDDEVAIIGSYNLDPRSLGLNSEDIVVVEHPPLAAELAAWVRDHDLPLADVVTAEQALAWADPASLPKPPPTVPPWDDPRFDPKALEYFLLRRVEGSL